MLRMMDDDWKVLSNDDDDDEDDWFFYFFVVLLFNYCTQIDPFELCRQHKKGDIATKSK